MNVASFFNSKTIKPVAEAPIVSKSPLLAPAFVASLDIAGPSYFPVPASLIAVVSVEDPLNCISTDPDNPHQHLTRLSLAPFACPDKALASRAAEVALSAE